MLYCRKYYNTVIISFINGDQKPKWLDGFWSPFMKCSGQKFALQLRLINISRLIRDLFQDKF